MKNYLEPQKSLPVYAEVDVLVAGGGPAGIGAALRAARLGMDTMIVESQHALGGVSTVGMMSHWGGRSSSKIMQEIFENQKKKSGTCGIKAENDAGDNAIHHLAQMIVLDEMMKEANVKVLFYTFVCGSIVEDGTLKGVIIENKSGRSVIMAKRIVDATGDGDVAAFAGVPYWKGRETDKKMQPCTIMFKIGGVDYSKAVFPRSFETTVQTDKGELQALAKEKLPDPAGHVLLYRQPTDNTVCCNMTNAVDVDGTNADDITKALLLCRSQMEPIVRFLKRYAPGYENCWLMTAGSLLGIRETRHFEGLESLREEDILQAKVFDNWIVKRAFFNFDVHSLTGSGLDVTGIQHNWSQPKDYTIPYGCILPKNVENLLLSGRNISGSHLAHSNFRIMSVCIALGEAAGTAAALSIQHNSTLAEVDVKEIQKIVGE